MKIAILQDKDFIAVPEYTADDVIELLKEKTTHQIISLSHTALEKFSRNEADILILPYITGNFSQKAFEKLLDFHKNAGSLLLLGDIPHIDKWYPYRNMQSFELHLTRCNDPIKVEGLTDIGKEIIGELKDFEKFKGKEFVGLCVTGFPDDITHNLIRNNIGQWERTCVVAIERKEEKFLGSRLAQIGFNGGEPREVACGAYPLDWTYNPGLLTREWKGIGPMILKLLDWLKPLNLDGAIRLKQVHSLTEDSPIFIEIKNLTNNELFIESIDLENNSKNTFSEKNIKILPNKTIKIHTEIPPRLEGLNNFSLKVRLNGRSILLHQTTEHILAENISKSEGFGVSTYYAFKTPKVTEEYKTFVRGMLDRGCQYVRVNIPWVDIEPKPGKYDWSITDQILEFAEQEDFQVKFWMFPTAIGSGLAEVGIPRWVLKEPAIDKNGNPGNFPCIWSPFYRQHYFAMVDALSSRYASSKRLDKFIIDFGNSDFAYGYYYYVNDPDLFDYSPYERDAFAEYLKNERLMSLEDLSNLYGENFDNYSTIPIPLSSQNAPWSIYLSFRGWSVDQGIKTVHSIILKNAPSKATEDMPGHGLGAISDISTAFYDVKKRHYYEEKKFPPNLVHLTSAGLDWGGEAWEVGGKYEEYDSSLFNSLRFNAGYNTIPGPDLNVFGEDIARIAFIRRSIMGAERKHPEIAVMGETTWDKFTSLPQIALRLDESADLLCNKHRFDFSCYKLMVLPCEDYNSNGKLLIPFDEQYYWLLREAVEKGMHILVFPNSCKSKQKKLQIFFREIMGINDITYSEPHYVSLEFPDSFGGGKSNGLAKSVYADGNILLKDNNGDALLVQRNFGKGSILLAGYDDSKESIDGAIHYENTQFINNHTLVRLIHYLQIKKRDLSSNQLYIFKDILRSSNGEFFLAYSQLKNVITQEFIVKLENSYSKAIDLATGEIFILANLSNGWSKFSIELIYKKGRYLKFY